MKRAFFLLCLLLALPFALSAQRAVRWTIGVNTPLVSNASTTFNYVGFSVKASYEKFEHLELGLSLSTEGYNREREDYVQPFYYLPNQSQGAPILMKFSETQSSLLASLNATYRWNPDTKITPLAGVAVGVSNDAHGKSNNFNKTFSSWNGFVAPHVGVLLWHHLDVRFSYYVAPKDFSRGMLSVGYKF